MFSFILFNLATTPPPPPQFEICEIPLLANHLWPMEIDLANLIIWGTWPEHLAWRRRTFIIAPPAPPAPKRVIQQKEKHYSVENRKHQYANQNRALRRSSRLMQPT